MRGEQVDSQPTKATHTSLHTPGLDVSINASTVSILSSVNFHCAHLSHWVCFPAELNIDQRCGREGIQGKKLCHTLLFADLWPSAQSQFISNHLNQMNAVQLIWFYFLLQM